MNKPTPLRVSAPVRRRPLASTDKSREEQKNNPPLPPPPQVGLDFDPIPLELRRVRATNGSNRKRDLAAVRMAEELERLERQQPVDVVKLAPVANRLWQSVPDSTFAIWLAPLRFAGADGSTLLLSAPEGIATWVERRYASLIRNALQGTGYTDVEFVASAGGGE